MLNEFPSEPLEPNISPLDDLSSELEVWCISSDLHSLGRGQRLSKCRPFEMMCLVWKLRVYNHKAAPLRLERNTVRFNPSEVFERNCCS